MATKIAINGFGRIGRCVLSALVERNLGANLEVVAINDLTDPKTLAHLLRYDSVHGRFEADVKPTEHGMTVAGRSIEVLALKDPKELPWQKLGVDVTHFEGPIIPIVYIVNLRDPSGYFLAQTFEMRNKDVLYISNAASVETTKFLNFLRTIMATANDPIIYATNGYALKSAINGGSTTIITTPTPITVMMIEPTIAFKSPPSVEPGGGVFSVNSCRLNPAPPL